MDRTFATKDAIEFLSGLESGVADCVITDIAYESLEKHRSVGTTTRLSHSDASSNDWFQVFKNENIPSLMSEIYRVMKPNTHFYFFCDDETAFVAHPMAVAAGFWFWNSLTWVKAAKEPGKLKMGMGYHYRRTSENILMFGRGPKPGKRDKRRLNDLSVPDVLLVPPIHKGYPTQKPEELVSTLLLNSTNAGDMVIDPFVGSGTTAVCAARHGRRFIVNDISAEAISVAKSRLAVLDGTHEKNDRHR